MCNLTHNDARISHDCRTSVAMAHVAEADENGDDIVRSESSGSVEERKTVRESSDDAECAKTASPVVAEYQVRIQGTESMGCSVRPDPCAYDAQLDFF